MIDEPLMDPELEQIENGWQERLVPRFVAEVRRSRKRGDAWKRWGFAANARANHVPFDAPDTEGVALSAEQDAAWADVVEADPGWRK